MTQAGTREYTEVVRVRYRSASKKERGRISDEFIGVVGCHRKSAVRLSKGKKRGNSGRKHGRQPEYGSEVVDILRMAWESTDRLCSERLQSCLPELLPILRRYGNRFISADVEARLCRMSPSTMDRLLHPCWKLGGRRPLSTTKPGTLLKNSIPIRTFTEWGEYRSGFLELDLVHHGGESTDGFYLTTLSTFLC